MIIIENKLVGTSDVLQMYYSSLIRSIGTHFAVVIKRIIKTQTKF
jgi:hypothetical protein